MSTAAYNPLTFIRTRLTWQAYITIGYYSYLLNSLGPLTPFLRDEMGLSYTIASFHFSAYALGVIFTGLLLNWTAQRFGVRTMVWVGVFGMAAGTLLLITGQHPVLTIVGAFLMGLLGGLISALLSSALAEHHGSFRAIALTESTMIASMLSTLAPLAIGFFGRTPLTWRAALGLMLFAAPALWVKFGRYPIGNEKSTSDQTTRKKSISHRSTGEQSTRLASIDRPVTDHSLTDHLSTSHSSGLPFRYWLYWVVIFLAEAIEFCIILWAADYLEKVSGFSKADAALGLSTFIGAMLVGRAMISRLLRRSKEQQLLMISLLVATAGFLLFWLAPIPALTIVGLVVAGLGVAGQFPIINALALSTVPDRMVEGSARVSLAVGLAIFLLPLLLARLADWVGIRAAYGLELALLFAAIALVIWAGKR